MLSYLLRRALLGVVTLTLVSLIAFAVVNLMPGDVIEARLADSPQARAELLPKLKHELGLDKPLYEQFGSWYGNVFRGDLGKSLFSGESVNSAIGRTFPATLEIAIIATLISIVLGGIFGTLAAVFQDTAIDHVTRFFTVGTLAVPDFWLATLFVVYASKWIGYTLPLGYASFFQDPGKNIQFAGIAATIIGIRFSGSLTRLVRSSMLEVLREDYMRTARAKGLNERRVVLAHGMRNAALPVLTLVGLQFAALLGGTVVVESIFTIPGTGSLLLASIKTRDFTMIQGLVLLFGTFLVFINLLVDFSYGFLDPRIRVNG